jgi:hypothetical protein
VRIYRESVYEISEKAKEKKRVVGKERRFMAKGKDVESE